MKQGRQQKTPTSSPRQQRIPSKIIQSKNRGGALYYLVRWQGNTKPHISWQNHRLLYRDFPQLVTQYHHQKQIPLPQPQTSIEFSQVKLQNDDYSSNYQHQKIQIPEVREQEMRKVLIDLLQNGGTIVEQMILDDENQETTKMYKVVVRGNRNIVVSEGLVSKYRPQMMDQWLIGFIRPQ